MLSNKGDVEEKMQCPYDKSHHILEHRMQTHLVKCARNYPDIRMATCSFNTTHRVPEPELKYHLSTCPDRLQIDKFIYKPETVKGSDTLFPIPDLAVKPEKYWDDEEEVPTYNPQEHCVNNPILRNSIHTKSAAVRRGFRNEERQRLQQFQNDTKTPVKQPSYQDPIQKERRPTGKSAGISNDVDKLDICDILEEINLNADVLTTPKLPPTTQIPNEVETPSTSNNEKDFPALQDDLNNPVPRTAPWRAADLAMSGIALNSGAIKRTFGRGTALSKK